jgi:hypothetical protein
VTSLMGGSRVSALSRGKTESTMPETGCPETSFVDLCPRIMFLCPF